jgi:hypothetical protein
MKQGIILLVVLSFEVASEGLRKEKVRECGPILTHLYLTARKVNNQNQGKIYACFVEIPK